MGENLRDYKTEGEKQIMDLLLQQAEERKQQQRQQANIFALKNVSARFMNRCRKMEESQEEAAWLTCRGF